MDDGESTAVRKENPMSITTGLVTMALAVSALVPTAGVTSAAPETAAEVHCVGEALPVGSADPAPEPVCFDTPEEAADFLEGVTQVHARGLAANVVLGTVYETANFGGSTYTFWGSSACNSATYGFASLTGGWDSRISSARSANGCWVTLYQATSYGGAKMTCMPNCSSVGGLNDQVRSIVFRPEGTIG